MVLPIFDVVFGVCGEFDPELDCCVALNRADDRVATAGVVVSAALFLLAFGVVSDDVST